MTSARGALRRPALSRSSLATLALVAPLASLFHASALPAVAQQVLALSGDVAPVHDPTAIAAGGAFYVFSTGGRPGQGVIPIRTSTDLRAWKPAGFVFSTLPEWATREIPQARNAWAPDISFRDGKYWLYYSVSSFGSRNSAIGLATNRTLDPASPDYRWADEGMVLRSRQESDDWNAIDPNVVIEDEHNVWLSWGSFWGGIKLRRLDPATGKPSSADGVLHTLASRPRVPPIDGSVEAPTIVRRGEWWYLFVSFDRCCRGAESSYNVVVGRSRSVTGPYLDRDGKPMTEGGGSLVIGATTPTWRGPGHQSVLRVGERDYLVFHAYYGAGLGRGSALQISTMTWEDGWPKVGTLP
jgi:arabinan endo-1,5-alpha-L-arabinosidase